MCELTEGRSVGCDAPGGSKKAYLYALRDSLGVSNYATGPTITAGAVAAMTLKAGKYIYPFNVEAESIDGGSESIGETGKGSSAFEHKTEITLMGNTAADCALAAKLVKGRVGVILQMNDGTYELYHFEEGFGGKLQRSRKTGKALDDMNGVTLTITSRQTGPEAKISSVIVNAMLAP